MSDLIEVKLLNYHFHFKPLKWREEFGIKVNSKKDRLRTILAHALVEISGLKVPSVEEAMKIFNAIPSTIVYRIYLIYQVSIPSPKVFKTMGLYKAPEPSHFIRNIKSEEERRDRVLDRVAREMEAKFGKKEIEEAKRLENLMLKNSKGIGLTPATIDPEGEI